MITLLWFAIRGALMQIMLALLTSKFMKDLILVGLRKLAEHTDNQVDDKIISIVEDAVHSQTYTELPSGTQVCPVCKTVLNQSTPLQRRQKKNS